MSAPSRVDVSWRTIGKILIAIALVWLWLQLWQFVMVVVLAIVLAIALDPAVRAMEHRGIPRWAGSVLSVLAIAAMAAGMLAAGWVSITEQSRVVAENLISFVRQVRSSFPGVEQLIPTAADGGAGLLQYALAFGRSATRAAGMFVVALVLTVYLLIEWKITVEWLIAFLPASQHQKARRTLGEARTTVFRYVVGNAVTSVITAIVTFVVLVLLKVPAALVLALIAGLFDFIPVVGFLLSLAVTGLLAATVSMTALIGVVVFYIVFNAVENYLIMPRVYGSELRMSKLAVLLAVAVGGQLGGVMGALLALPIAAIYPTIERIWLRQQLGAETVEAHEQLSA